MRVVNKYLVLLVIVCLAGCGIGWQKATKATVAGLAKATSIAGDESIKYFEDACSKAAAASYDRGCNLSGDLSLPECSEVKLCFDTMTSTKDKILSVYRLLKLTLIAVDLGDKSGANTYLAKALLVAKEVYSIIRVVAPNALPVIPLLE